MTAPAALAASPLTPMQAGMLFHSLSDPASDVYVQQLAGTLRGRLHEGAFRAAWERAVARHDVLRTAFAVAGLPEPLQVVGPRARLPLACLDWSGQPAGAHAPRLDALRAEEPRRGLDPARAPLMRLVLVRLGARTHHLLWTWHHAILDAWSVGVVLDEVFATYAALCAGPAPDFSGPPDRSGPPELAPAHPFGDFVAWLAGRDRAADEAYWRRTLAGVAAPTPLAFEPGGPPADRGPPGPGEAGPGPAGYGLRFADLPEAEVAEWRAAARAAGVTPNTLVQGAWALLLARAAGQREVVFGAAAAVRPPELPDVETRVGLFINTLPVRVRVAPEDRAGDWLRALQSAQAQAGRHAHAPLAEIQAWSGLARGLPLFESLLVYEEFAAHRAAPGGGGLVLHDRAVFERADAPLTVTLVVRDSCALGVGYDRARFSGAAMEALLARLRRLLVALARGLAGRLADLDLLDRAERRLIVEGWSRAPAPVPAAARLPARAVSRLFEEQARRTPEAPAVTFAAPDGDVSLSYAALDAAADGLARRLRGLGVGRESRVALCLEPSPDRIVGLLAVLKAGGAYVPLDPGAPAASLRDLARDCGAGAVLCEAARADLFAGIPVVRREGAGFEGTGSKGTGFEGAGPRDGPPDEALPDGPEPGDAAYVIYTSGSTGRRKGVLVTHDALRRMAEAQRGALGIGPHSRVLQAAAFGFDASVWEIVPVLLSGGRLYGAPRDALLPSPELRERLARWRIDTLTLPPSILARLPAGPLPDLRTLVSAGEPCPAALAALWAPGRTFINAYGPTEATVCASLAPVSAGEARPAIGRPFGEARLYVLDGDMNPVPPGTVGHLHVGGPGLARGYVGRPDLTAAAFVPDPFSGEPGARLYRTGDLACFRPDGRVDCLGRRDDQVKIRGFRIEPGEIEAALREEPAVREAAVVALGEAWETRRLVAAVVLEDRDGGAFEGAALLRERLRGRLPDHMLPSAVVSVGHLPLTASGKRDRRALAAEIAAREAGAARAGAPAP
ncbi:amino acid adenylation domain-containing protein, partial [Methylobacterium crusticola]